MSDENSGRDTSEDQHCGRRSRDCSPEGCACGCFPCARATVRERATADDQPELDSPPFRPAALDELEARGFRRVNRAPASASPVPPCKAADSFICEWLDCPVHGDPDASPTPVTSNPSTDADRANRFYEDEWDTCQPTRTVAALVKLIAESRTGLTQPAWGTCKHHPGAEPGCGECLRDLLAYRGRDAVYAPVAPLPNGLLAQSVPPAKDLYDELWPVVEKHCMKLGDIGMTPLVTDLVKFCVAQAAAENSCDDRERATRATNIFGLVDESARGALLFAVEREIRDVRREIRDVRREIIEASFIWLNAESGCHDDREAQCLVTAANEMRAALFTSPAPKEKKA